MIGSQGRKGDVSWILDSERQTVNAPVLPLDKHNVKLLNNVAPKSWINPEASHFQLVVIGAGAGGLISTIQATALDLKVAIIEENIFGGDCLNFGCVPSKALLKCSKLIQNLNKAKDFGIHANITSINFPAIMERMRKLRSDISKADSFERYSGFGASVFKGRAKFVSDTSVEIDSLQESTKRVLTFEKCIIATGTHPFIPPILGLREVPYLTNSTLFNLEVLPKAFGILGAGPIGMEMAQAFNSFGSKVFVFEISDRILKREDSDASNVLLEFMEQDGVEIFVKTKVISCEKVGNQIKITYERDNHTGTVLLDQLLVATGRIPNIERLNLAAASVTFLEGGGIVNDNLQTSNRNIFAVGDVCCNYQFTHYADATAKVAFRNAMFPFSNLKASNLVVPWCTYTNPEVAHVGSHEHDLLTEKKKFRVFKKFLEHNDRVILDSSRSNKGFVKLIVDQKTDKILGCTIVSENAGDLISEVTTAIANDVGAKALSAVIHPYPTTADSIRLCAGEVNKARITENTKWMLKQLVWLKHKFWLW